MFVNVGKKMRWCTVSETEQKKCAELSKALVAVLPPAAVAAFARLSCVRASSTADCIDKIRVRSGLSSLPFLQICVHTPQYHLLPICLSTSLPLSRPYVPPPTHPFCLGTVFYTSVWRRLICCLTDFLSGKFTDLFYYDYKSSWFPVG